MINELHLYVRWWGKAQWRGPTAISLRVLLHVFVCESITYNYLCFLSPYYFYLSSCLISFTNCNIPFVCLFPCVSLFTLQLNSACPLHFLLTFLLLPVLFCFYSLYHIDPFSCIFVYILCIACYNSEALSCFHSDLLNRLFPETGSYYFPYLYVLCKTRTELYDNMFDVQMQ